MSRDLANKEDLAQARATASQIRQGIHNYLATLALIAKANKERHWKVLGYDNWQSYVDGEFGAERLRLPAEHRAKAVQELRLAGLSTRAIGTAIGVDEKTVRNDLAGAEFSAPEEITGTDGKQYAASRPGQPAAKPVEADAQLDAPAPTGAREAETGVAPPAEAGDGAGVLTGAPAPQTAVDGPGASPSTDADGEGEVPPFLVRADAAGAPTDRPSAGAPVNPLDDPEEVERQHRLRSSKSVAEGLVHLYSALDPDPIRWLTKWVPDAYGNRGIPFVEDILTPEGIRTVAKHLDTLADYLDKTDGAL